VNKVTDHGAPKEAREFTDENSDYQLLKMNLVSRRQREV
jgi:hypothetical protein